MNVKAAPAPVANRLGHARRRLATRRFPNVAVDRAGQQPPIDRGRFDVPSHSITTDAAWFMHEYVIERGLSSGMEIGSKFGWSGIWLTDAIARTGGRLLMLDMKLRRRLVENFRTAEVGNATIVLGDSTSEDVAAAARALTAERPLDFAFIDGDHSYEARRSDYRLALECAGPELHVFFDNVWETEGVYRVFAEEPANEKLIAHAFRKDAPNRAYPECLGLHVVRRAGRGPAAPASPGPQLTPAFFGSYLVTASGKVEDGAPDAAAA